MLQIFSTFNSEEKDILREMLTKNESTKYVRYDDYQHPLLQAPLGGIEDFDKVFSVFNGLRAKGIIHAKQSGYSWVFRIIPDVWEMLKKYNIVNKKGK